MHVASLFLEHVQHSFDLLGKPPSDSSPAGALLELSGLPGWYGEGDEATRVSYDDNFISWPNLGSIPILVAEVLGKADRELMCEWRSRLLATAEDFEQLRDQSSVKKPYSDPALIGPALSTLVFFWSSRQGVRCSSRRKEQLTMHHS